MLRPLVLLAAYVNVSMALNILVFLLGTSQPERSNMEIIAQQLALRHHTVVTVKPILIPEEPRLVMQKLHLVREKTLKNLLPKKQYEPLEKALTNSPWKTRYDYEDYLEPYYAAHNASCGRILNSDLAGGLIKDSIDVAIVYNGNPCQLALCHVLGVPVVYFDQEGLTDETLVASNTPIDLEYPLSHCELAMKTSNPLFSRIASSLCILAEIAAQSGIPSLASLVSKRYRLMDGPITRQFAQDYYLKKRFPSFPDVNTLKQQAALYLVNTDPLLEYERALPPHVIPVGGLHMDHPKPLFSPWNDTIKDSKDGTIVVSFGTHINASSMSEAQARDIYGALSQLTNYRIIWCVGPPLRPPGIDIEKAPRHINITAYLPQADILADKRTKLLVTNGGPASLMEAIAYGVPIVGIPLYGANLQNIEKAVYKGMGVMLPKSQITEHSLLSAMKTVLNSAKYRTVAKDMSKEYKSRQNMGSAFDRAAHYIEHVGKHRTAVFMRPQNRPLSHLRQLPLEAILLLFLVFAGPLMFIYIAFRVASSMFRYRQPSSDKPVSEKVIEPNTKPVKAK